MVSGIPCSVRYERSAVATAVDDLDFSGKNDRYKLNMSAIINPWVCPFEEVGMYKMSMLIACLGLDGFIDLFCPI